MFNWNDIRLFLAVARAGSTLGAARELGLNQTTVSRRMQILEHELQLTLFEHRTTGYRLTEDGKQLCDQAAAMAGCAEELQSVASGLRRKVSGTLRVTAPEVVFACLVAPVIAEFREAYPDVRIEYDSSEILLDLAQGQADVALRATEQALDERLAGQRLPNINWTVYCSHDYAERNGMPASIAEVRAHPVVIYGSTVSQRPGNLWFMDHVDGGRVAGTSNTVLNMASVLRAGIGVGLLPCMQGDREPTLCRCFEPMEQLCSQLWLLTALDTRRIPRVAKFVELAAKRIRAQKDIF